MMVKTWSQITLKVSISSFAKWDILLLLLYIANHLKLSGVKRGSECQKGHGREIFSSRVSHALAVRYPLELQSSEGSTRLDMQDGPLTWLAAMAGAID